MINDNYVKLVLEKLNNHIDVKINLKVKCLEKVMKAVIYSGWGWKIEHGYFIVGFTGVNKQFILEPKGR